MNSKLLSSTVVAVALLAAAGETFAVPTDFSFGGNFTQDDNVQLFNFTANGSSTVTLETYSYAGGTQADGTVVARGGFDPILALFDSSGALVGQNDDGGPSHVPVDPNTGEYYDTFLQQVLAAGNYTVAVMQYNNFAVGPNLSDGFTEQGNGNFTGALGNCTQGFFCDVSGVDPWNNRDSHWAFDILNVETAQQQIPEPTSIALMALGLAGLGFTRRKSS